MATGRRTGARSRWSGGPRKKTLNLDQGLLDEAREALGARTETDAITLALEAVVQRKAQIQGLRALAAMGPVDRTRIG